MKKALKIIILKKHNLQQGIYLYIQLIFIIIFSETNNNENYSDRYFNNNNLINLSNKNENYYCAADLAAGPIQHKRQTKEQIHDRSREFERSYDFSGDD